jgi:hypothetical protein
MLTRKNIVDALQLLRNSVKQWEASTDQTLLVRWRTGPRKSISEQLLADFDALFNFVDRDDVDNEMKATVLSIDEFESVFVDWCENCGLNPDETDPNGGRKFWDAFEAIYESLDVPHRKLPEPIEALVTDKVSERQIALIYGWKNPDGSGDVNKVREEREAPGTHYNPRTWVHPSDKRRHEEIEARWALRKRRPGKESAGTKNREAPESIDELIQQRVPSKQIAMMKKVDIEVVRARAAELNIPLDGQFVPRIQPVDIMQGIRDDEADRLATMQKLGEQQPLPLPQRVMDLHSQGKSLEAIVDILKAENPKLTMAKIEKILQSAAETAGANSGI